VVAIVHAVAKKDAHAKTAPVDQIAHVTARKNNTKKSSLNRSFF